MRRLGVDYDNVIADTDTLNREVFAELFGVKAARREVVTFEYEKCLRLTKQQRKEGIEEMHRRTSQLRALPHAAKCLAVLTHHYRIDVVTSRPSWTKEQMTRWMQRRKIQPDTVIFADDKAALAPKYSWFLDDNLEDALSICNSGTRVLLFDYPWNRCAASAGVRRVRGWREALHILTNSC